VRGQGKAETERCCRVEHERFHLVRHFSSPSCGITRFHFTGSAAIITVNRSVLWGAAACVPSAASVCLAPGAFTVRIGNRRHLPATLSPAQATVNRAGAVTSPPSPRLLGVGNQTRQRLNAILWTKRLPSHERAGMSAPFDEWLVSGGRLREVGQGSLPSMCSSTSRCVTPTIRCSSSRT
jgi:hypothetical protein